MAAWAKRVRNLKDRSMVLFLMDTRLPADEIVLLDMAAIVFSARERPDGLIETVGRGAVPSPERGISREFFLSARTVEALDLYWASRPHECDKEVVFTTRVGGRRLLKLIGMMIREWCYRFIFERLQLDKLRHSLVHRLLAGGCSLGTLGRPLG
jgi:integrase